MRSLTSFEQKLLESWEEVYKKGQLTFWIFVALTDGPKHMAEIRTFITEATHNLFHVEDQSLYRALRRYHAAELIEYTDEPGTRGPDLKIYSLTKTGHAVFESFVERNIRQTLYSPTIRKLIEKK